MATAGILAALVGLAGLLIFVFFVYKRRKKDEEETSDENASV
jgi:LPXTG-motif cell wall-anchored protein